DVAAAAAEEPVVAGAAVEDGGGGDPRIDGDEVVAGEAGEADGADRRRVERADRVPAGADHDLLAVAAKGHGHEVVVAAAGDDHVGPGEGGRDRVGRHREVIDPAEQPVRLVVGPRRVVQRGGVAGLAVADGQAP